MIKYITDNVHSISDESFTLKRDKSIKIIWNITNKCTFNCDICATRAEANDRKELDLESKKNVYYNILKYGVDHIKEIDFSGGDPLQQDESISIIRDTIQMLGKDKVCITTTGIGLNKIFKIDNAVDLLYKCEVTIDDIIEDSTYNRSANTDYILKNITALHNHSSQITFLIINVPIINPKLNPENIKKLVDSIDKIDAPHKTVNLIRLMPVGSATPDTGNDLHREDPETFISTFKRFADEKGINYRLQCALRGKYENGHCNMLEEKIGVDCAGNVFACAWGGYVKKNDGTEFDNISDNPFYLGNLTQNDLPTILSSEKSVRIRSKLDKQTSHCRVYNYVCSGSCDFSNNCDPLI